MKGIAVIISVFCPLISCFALIPTNLYIEIKKLENSILNYSGFTGGNGTPSNPFMIAVAPEITF